jgi:hypothetical protein
MKESAVTDQDESPTQFTCLLGAFGSGGRNRSQATPVLASL